MKFVLTFNDIITMAMLSIAVILILKEIIKEIIKSWRKRNK